MRIVAWRECGESGTIISEPVNVEWRQYDRILTAPMWWLTGFFVVVGLPCFVIVLFYLRRQSHFGDRVADLPAPTGPTSTAVTAADLVGQWQVYLDNVCQTVRIEFQPDGTFTQTMIANQGNVQRCPGGTWSLEGALVRVTGYVATGDSAGRNLTWWLIDTPAGLALYGGESPNGPSFVWTRRRLSSSATEARREAAFPGARSWLVAKLLAVVGFALGAYIGFHCYWPPPPHPPGYIGCGHTALGEFLVRICYAIFLGAPLGAMSLGLAAALIGAILEVLLRRRSATRGPK